MKGMTPLRAFLCIAAVGFLLGALFGLALYLYLWSSIAPDIERQDPIIMERIERNKAKIPSLVASSLGVAGIGFSIVSSAIFAASYVLNLARGWLWIVCLVGGGLAGALAAAAVTFWNSVAFWTTLEFDGQVALGGIVFAFFATCPGFFLGLLLGTVTAWLLSLLPQRC